MVTLRRVTFSGRLIHREAVLNEERWMTVARGLVFGALDIVIVLATGIAIFYMFAGYAVRPRVQGFYCNDTSIKQPLLPNTVTTSHLLIVSLASPLLIIAVAEALLFSNCEGTNRLAKFFRSTTLEYLEYLLVYTVCTLLMELLKCSFGRLRPHFLSACQPDWTSMDCTTDPNAYIENVVCMATPHRIRVSRTSFPSGHTAAACFVLFFAFFYLNRLVRASRGLKSLLIYRSLLLVPLSMWTLFVAVSRVTDYWHFPSDVAGGVLLALSCILPAFAFRSDDYVYEKRELIPPLGESRKEK